MRLVDRLFQPGAGGYRFAEEIRDELRLGRSVVVPVARQSVGESLGRAIRAAVQAYGLDLQVVDLNGRAGEPALEVVAREIGMAESPEDLSHLAEWAREALGVPHVLELEGLEELSSEGRRDWLGFLGRWSGVVRPREDGRPPRPAFWMSGRAPFRVDPWSAGPRLLVRPAWALVTAAERNRLVENAGVDRPEEEAPSQRWRQHVLPPLLVGDLDLAEVLWNRLGTLSEVLDALKGEAARRGWSEADATELLDELLSRPLPASASTGIDEERLARFWAAGVGDLTRDDGFQISSALLAQAGSAAEIRHRYWSGQVSLVLPVVDRFRLRLCGELTGALGTDWVKLVPPTIENEGRDSLTDPFAAELGQIEEAVGSAPELRCFRHVLPLIRDVRWTRNEIAHYRPISCRFFRELAERVGTIWGSRSATWANGLA